MYHQLPEALLSSFGSQSPFNEHREIVEAVRKNRKREKNNRISFLLLIHSCLKNAHIFSADI